MDGAVAALQDQGILESAPDAGGSRTLAPGRGRVRDDQTLTHVAAGALEPLILDRGTKFHCPEAAVAGSLLLAESGLWLYFAALAAKQAREATAASAGILAFSSTIDRKLRILRGRVLECSMAFRTGSRT